LEKACLAVPAVIVGVHRETPTHEVLRKFLVTPSVVPLPMRDLSDGDRFQRGPTGVINRDAIRIDVGVGCSAD
jgi:hypothetical protein